MREPGTEASTEVVSGTTNGDGGSPDDRPLGTGTGPHASDERAALIRLGLIVAGAAVGAVLTGVVRTALVVLALIVMVLLHELGHFLTAKWAGMKVTEFFFGFGPRLWSVRKGETEYGIKALPLGGYCKIPGMINVEKVDPADEPRTYRQQPYWRRLTVGVAGSAVHFILAFLLLYAMFAMVGVINYDKELPEVGEISRLESGPSPAQIAGFRVGDRLLSYDGIPFRSFEGLRDHIRQRPEQPVTFVVDRNGERLSLIPTTVDLSKVAGEEGRRVARPTGFVGIGPAFAVEKSGPLQGLGEAGTSLGRLTGDTFKALTNIFSPSGASSYARQLSGRGPGDPEDESSRFLSPVGFVQVAGYAANEGWREVLTLLILINVFVGIFNMVPLLPFDGGHVAIATYERLRSRRGQRYYADVSKALPIFYMVIAVLVFIGVSSLYLDIVRPLGNPFQ